MLFNGTFGFNWKIKNNCIEKVVNKINLGHNKLMITSDKGDMNLN